ncbi:hypothetical protein B9479_007378 [Cryptococcus floricola]|uniref:carnosine N-methyltransferase n=1 Tax=Cryptococcus floricola TaxID=2591691 RepID=A0A5D3AKI8_9TREE|nr:hypothetical protein B9479_007378 [Cryptococcus floricola]
MAEERRHWQAVIKAFDGYQHYHMSAQHARKMSVLTLPKAEKEIYRMLGYMDKVEAVDEGIRQNQEFLDEMIANPVFSEMLKDPELEDVGHSHAGDHSHDHSHGHSHSHSQPQPQTASRPGSPSKPSRSQLDAAQDKVRSTLRSFVRDWSPLGQPERDACYRPCLEALEKYFPSFHDYPEGGEVEIDVDVQGQVRKEKRRVRKREEVKVLVPGCGLGRLAMEIASQGFTAQGNEFSTYMLIASDWVLNQTTRPNSHTIYPFLHSFSNHLTTEHHLLLSTTIPDVCPSDVFARTPHAGGGGKYKPGAFSLVAGDFEEIYGQPSSSFDREDGGDKEDEKEDQTGQWDAIVTCFFIDCSRNVLNYLRTIHDLLPPLTPSSPSSPGGGGGGVWINIGPLLWHFENSPTTSAKGERSVELSLDEVKQLGDLVGFEFQEEKMIKSTYTSPPESMLRHEYTTAFWVATKKEPRVLIEGDKVVPNPRYTDTKSA